jgi:hypothetical protein
MLVISSPDNSPSLPLIEGGLTLIAIAAAFCWPRLGVSWFSRLERALGKLAARKRLAVVTVGAAALLLRLAILPLCPIPVPCVTDDFSFLLAADTFLHGRLANPTPAMWVHFETIHVDMQPTYMSMYFPAQGLILAAGKLFFGHPWYGSLIISALMCAAICWMLQAWLPARWALLGGAMAVVHLGLFSYWLNTYHSGGLIGALGGALVLGAMPRLIKTARFRYGVLIALGISILILTRPYEGMLLGLPVAAALGRWALFGKNRPSAALLMRRAIVPLGLIAATLAWLGYYDLRAFGKATTLPYTINRTTYAMAPYFVWQHQRPEPAYRHAELKRFYYEDELDFYYKIHSRSGFLYQSLIKGLSASYFFSGFALMPPLIMLRRVFLDRRIRFLVVCSLLIGAGLLIQIYVIPHYVAAFTAAFYAIGLQCVRHLRLWKPESKPVGRTLVRLLVAVCLVMAACRTFAGQLSIPLKEWPVHDWNFNWYGPGIFGTERAGIQAALEKLPGKQVAIVHYGPKHIPIDEWIYNSADINGQKVIWAREMDSANNEELIQYYKDRQIWLVDADSEPAMFSPYPTPFQLASAKH